MSESDLGWSIRALLNPVITRLLIYGVNAMELERVVSKLESAPLRGPRDLETRWLEEWDQLACQWQKRAADALASGHRRTAATMALYAAGSHLAKFLINTAQLDRKRKVYEAYAASYRRAAECFEPPAQSLSIPFDAGHSMAALLHLPARPAVGPHPCVAIFAGLGSCKEEMHVLARAMAERGVAALVPDLPGCGETLFHSWISCGGESLNTAFRAVADLVEQRPELDASRLGVCGLCMGGGYAYRAASRDRRYQFCATLFPLFIDQVAATATPQWMRSGAWLQLQTGGIEPDDLIRQLGMRESERLRCPYFLVHGRHDNWMPLDRAMLLYDRAPADARRLLVIEDEPLYSKGHAVTHTMPVGEQLHWVAPVVADWIADQTRSAYQPEAR